MHFDRYGIRTVPVSLIPNASFPRDLQTSLSGECSNGLPPRCSSDVLSGIRNLSMAGKPSFLNYLPPLSKETAMLEHAGYRDRVRGVQATDEMIVRHSHRKQLLACHLIWIEGWLLVVLAGPSSADADGARDARLHVHVLHRAPSHHLLVSADPSYTRVD